MTTRERMEARLAKRREWADARKREAAGAFQRASDLISGIPPGQPVLIGHHSQRRHERALERHDSTMRRGAEAVVMAKTHAYKAEGLEATLASTVFHDDSNAVKALEAKIAGLEAQRDRMKAINAALRKGKGKVDSLVPPLTEAERADLQSYALYSHTSTGGGYPSYALTNLGGRIRQAEARILDVGRRTARAAEATAAGGVLIRESGVGIRAYTRVTFDAKPSREVLTALREADYTWSGGSWVGPPDRLPACVRAMAARPAEDAVERELLACEVEAERTEQQTGGVP